MDIDKLIANIVSDDMKVENECLEFKENTANPEEMGEYISALSNAAMLHGLSVAYMIWGIEDKSKLIVGTSFRPYVQTKGNQTLSLFLQFGLNPRIDFSFHEAVIQNKNVVVLMIPAARTQPTAWKGKEYIRIGSSKVELRGLPEKEKQIWRSFDTHDFETDWAKQGATMEEVLTLIDYDAYFRLRKITTPSTFPAILNRLVTDRLILPGAIGGFDVSNATALLFAKRLSSFSELRRKMLRIITYTGKSKTQALYEAPTELMDKGYAAGFKQFEEYILQIISKAEIITSGQRQQLLLYPAVAIREFLANVLIHQDLTMKGVDPVVEIFSDRIAFTNPGTPLIETLRFVDAKRSRNEFIAEMMHSCNLCERRGSGIDRALEAIEEALLPAPFFEIKEGTTVCVLYSAITLNKMTKEEKIRACYLHTCLQHESNEDTTNTSLRKRFGISDVNYSIASRIISDTIVSGLILPADPENTSKKLSRYVPFWVGISM